jgi:hypothetical protein
MSGAELRIGMRKGAAALVQMVAVAVTRPREA